MRKMRWLAALLALCLLLAGLPAALAEEAVEADPVLVEEKVTSEETEAAEAGEVDLFVEEGAEADAPAEAISNALDVQANAASDFVIENGVLVDYKGSDEWITIPSGVHTIGELAFYKNDQLFGVTIPGTVKTIEYGAFAFCENLRSVEIKSGTKTIGEDAFEYCECMFEFIAPKSITSIGNDAFYGCYDLLISCFSGSAMEKYAIDNDLDYEIVDNVAPDGIDIATETDGTELKKGKSIKLDYNLNPRYATTKVTWKSSNESVATVTASGKVTGVSAGTAIITVTTANNKRDSFKVMVYDPNAKATAVKFVDEYGDKITKLTLYTGQIMQMGNGVETTPYGVAAKRTWKSSNKKVATVSSTGKIVAQKPGKANITVKINGKSAKLKVTVKKNKLDKINSKPKLSAIGYGQDIWLKSIEIKSPKKIVCEYYLLFKRLTSMTTTKFSWVEGSAYYYDDDYNQHKIFDGTVKNIKIKTKGQTVKKFKVTYKGSKVKNTNLILKNLKGQIYSSEDFWLNWVY